MTTRRAARIRCATCGGADDDAALVRVVFVRDVGWVPDERRRLRGDAIDVHCTARCVDGVAAARAEPSIDAAALHAALARWLDAAVLDALSRAAAAGDVVAGHDVLSEALRAGRIAALVFSRSTAARTRRSLERAAGPDVARHTLDVDNEALGVRVGERPLAAVGVPATRAAAPLRRRLAMRAALAGRGER